MKTFGNVLWLIFGGIEMGIGAFFGGLFCFISIIFIPVGFQQFKLCKFYFWPMGKKVEKTNPNGFKAFCNVLWAIVCGWWYALINFLVGAILCITIIGIPFGKQYFKIAKFVFTPLGHDFVDDVPVATAPATK